MEERRKHPRIEKNFPIKLKQFPDKEFDISTETTNISANGAYCAVNKAIEPMTKLNLTLLVPLARKKIKKIKTITCSGVVVRKEKTPENKKYPYRIGIFFNEIDSLDRKFLQSYVKSSFKKS